MNRTPKIRRFSTEISQRSLANRRWYWSKPDEVERRQQLRAREREPDRPEPCSRRRRRARPPGRRRRAPAWRGIRAARNGAAPAVGSRSPSARGPAGAPAGAGGRATPATVSRRSRARPRSLSMNVVDRHLAGLFQNWVTTSSTAPHEVGRREQLVARDLPRRLLSRPSRPSGRRRPCADDVDVGRTGIEPFFMLNAICVVGREHHLGEHLLRLLLRPGPRSWGRRRRRRP